VDCSSRTAATISQHQRLRGLDGNPGEEPPIDIADYWPEKGRVFLKYLDDSYEFLVNLGCAFC